MIEAEGKEDGLLELPSDDQATVNLTALMGGLGDASDPFSPRDMGMEEGLLDGEPAGGRVKDGLLESFLLSNFPDEEVGRKKTKKSPLWC